MTRDMKYLFLIVLAVAVLVLTVGCTTKTEFGRCVGISDKQNPDLEYKPSTNNLIVGILFMELVAPPIIVIVDEFYCPIGKKDPNEPQPQN